MYGVVNLGNVLLWTPSPFISRCLGVLVNIHAKANLHGNPRGEKDELDTLISFMVGPILPTVDARNVIIQHGE